MSDTPGTYAANWYPDPFGRFELRYYDGKEWTQHVSSNGKQSEDPPVGTSHVPTVDRAADKIQADVAKASAAAQRGAAPSPSTPGGGTIFTEPVLVVNQKAKLIEVNNEYAIYDQQANQIGAVRQVGQSTAKKLLRIVSSVDQYLSHKLQVVDMAGSPLLVLTRPAKLMKSKVIVEDSHGNEVGQIVQQNVIGKIHFSLEAGGQTIGSINAENWRAWNFNIQDSAGAEIARITKTFEGIAKTMFTTADNYVVHIHRRLDEPLRSLVVAAALSVDTALKQDSRGFN